MPGHIQVRKVRIDEEAKKVSSTGPNIPGPSGPAPIQAPVPVCLAAYPFPKFGGAQVQAQGAP